jgi:hypothetical protein
MANAYRTFIGKLERKRSIEDLGADMKIILK